MVSGVPCNADILASHNVVIIWNEVAQGTEIDFKEEMPKLSLQRRNLNLYK